MDPLSIALLVGGGYLLYKGFSTGSLVKDRVVRRSDGAVFLIQGGQLHLVPDPETLFAMGYTWSDVQQLPDAEIKAIPLGANLVHKMAPLGGSGGVAPVAGQVPWPPGPGQPGYVTIGGQPPPSDYSLGNLQTAIQASGVGTALAGGTIGVAGAIGGAGGAGSAIGTTAATAIPIVGIGIAAAGIVLGIIAKHHAEAVAKEAAGLNQSVPVILQRYVLILQAVIRGEVTDLDQVQGLVAQAVNDYYSMVKSIIQGRWSFAQTATTVQEWLAVNANTQGKPSTCNGPCVVGHYWIEGYGQVAVIQARTILAGGHGIATFGSIPSHAGFAGMPEIKVIY